MGTTLREIIFDIGGGIANGKKFKACRAAALGRLHPRAVPGYRNRL
jgi:NADH:ubiquinone oxidoreductase subunit F (NADH-binding)